MHTYKGEWCGRQKEKYNSHAHIRKPNQFSRRNLTSPHSLRTHSPFTLVTSPSAELRALLSIASYIQYNPDQANAISWSEIKPPAQRTTPMYTSTLPSQRPSSFGPPQLYHSNPAPLIPQTAVSPDQQLNKGPLLSSSPPIS